MFSRLLWILVTEANLIFHYTRIWGEIQLLHPFAKHRYSAKGWVAANACVLGQNCGILLKSIRRTAAGYCALPICKTGDSRRTRRCPATLAANGWERITPGLCVHNSIMEETV